MAKGKKMLYTQQGYQELINELNYLKGEKREQIKNDIAVARSFGDLSENSEYDEARNEQAKNEARIKELEELLENAAIIDESAIDTSVVSLGSTVRVYDYDFKEEVSYSIVGSNEANPLEGKISDLSPIGAALIDMRAGEEKEIETPNGILRIKVLEVGRTQA
ncbi:MAG: transcription elongation factor GreA [Clostridia bacterium]|nr:transcription elongation factor GreA [Clostridia bacterium]MBQ3639019.1 transcription elongation factor GreA [Clostridia bacterium]